MPQQLLVSVENNFTKGLITEATGLNFPENAATDTSNCVYTLIGDVARREGINFEANGTTDVINRAGFAMSTYIWNNPGGDGNSKLFVKQVGNTLYFYDIAAATVASPLSNQLLASTVLLTGISGGTFDTTQECTYADGNGYLFVYQPTMDPVYVSYNVTTQVFTSATISIQIRDFTGVNDGLAVNQRPLSLDTNHQYNLQNQGWVTAAPWGTTSASTYQIPLNIGSSYTFQVDAGLSGVTLGQVVGLQGNYNLGGLTNVFGGSAIVTAYSGTTMTLDIQSGYTAYPGINISSWSIYPQGLGTLSTWNSDEGNYPSNADVWWYFKDDTGVFNPSTTQPNVTLASGQAPQGHYILPAFNMDRNIASGLHGITVVSTTKRPTNGCWFQGRVWYTGVSAGQIASPDTSFYTWTENIYYSQIVTDPTDFGNCYQTNDPTSEDLNDPLATDGGVVPIVGSGTIHKLFSIQNGMLIFANNGVWFLTGSQGIGFAANDYTITKISSVKILSSHSFIDVLGLPYFWNEDGIYQVSAQQNGSLAVEPLTVGTIETYYDNIPLASKKFARGSYDPIQYIIQWSYKSTQEEGISDRYQMDTILAYNTYNKAFYPYNIMTGNNTQYIHGVEYVSYPYINTQTPDPGFKYHCSQLVNGSFFHGFAEEYDEDYVDWGDFNYVSSFITGYKLRGQGLKKSQVSYINTFNRNVGYAAFYLQVIWGYATSPDSNKWSQPQFVELNVSNTGVNIRRHKLRGRGRVLQLQFTSVDGRPFDLMGWSAQELVNTGV